MPTEIKGTHTETLAKRKLNEILRTNSLKDKHIDIRDMVEVFIKNSNNKQGFRTQPKAVLKFDSDAKMITIAGSNGKIIRAAIEDTRHAINPNNELIRYLKEAHMISKNLLMIAYKIPIMTHCQKLTNHTDLISILQLMKTNYLIFWSKFRSGK